MDVTLVMFRTDGSRKEFPITRERTKIGRTRGCDLRIPLSSVSREHCELVIERVCASIRDLESSNGTFVNRKPIDEVMLEAGDEIAIGPVIFTVVIDGQPVRIDPRPAKLDRQTRARPDRSRSPRVLTMDTQSPVDVQEEAYTPTTDFDDDSITSQDEITRTFNRDRYPSKHGQHGPLTAEFDSGAPGDPNDSRLESQRSGIRNPEPV